uniref:CSON000403 protein n=1 Tax=Culicoides sonorensis TaxID=179676 RepID=A0A336LTT9_CULSO
MQRRLSKPKRHLPGQWTSYNKVLVGSGKRPHARNPNFDWEETKLLISLWGDPKVQRTLITTHKKYPVIARIAEKMREHGYNRTPEEINTRIKNLKCFYNRVKKDIELGIISSPSWKHYDDMDEILSRPIFGNNARMPENSVKSESQSSQSPKDSVAHLVEPEMRIKEENMSDDDLNNDIEIAASSSNNDLIIPKDEPLDIDDGNLLDSEMDDDFDDDFAESNDELSSPPAKIQRTRSELSLKSLPPLEKLQTRPVEIKLIETPVTNSSQTVISNSVVSTGSGDQTAGTGKISLVPTKVLLKPKPQSTPGAPIITVNAQPKPTQAPSQVVVSQSPATSSQVSSQGMKVLFVNAMPQSTTSSQPANTSQTVTMTATPIVQQQKPMPKVMPPLHPTIPPSTRISVIPQPNPISITQKAAEQKGTGFRHLLSQLIQLQNENLLMQRQRLLVEKQRLEVEKTFGTRIVDLLTNIQTQNTLSLANKIPVTTASSSSTPAYRLRRERKANDLNNHDSTDEDESQK